MEIYQSIILAIVQGITELLPISSSAHLNLIPWIFNWNIPESFDVALHFGTLLAICIFFFKDWIGLIKGGFESLQGKKTLNRKNILVHSYSYNTWSNYWFCLRPFCWRFIK